MRKTPKTAKGQETLAKINEAAKLSIKRYGRDGFTTNHVAKEAGVSIGTVYSVYRNRIEILDELWPGRPNDTPLGWE